MKENTLPLGCYIGKKILNPHCDQKDLELCLYIGGRGTNYKKL